MYISVFCVLCISVMWHNLCLIKFGPSWTKYCLNHYSLTHLKVELDCLKINIQTFWLLIKCYFNVMNIMTMLKMIIHTCLVKLMRVFYSVQKLRLRLFNISETIEHCTRDICTMTITILFGKKILNTRLLSHPNPQWKEEEKSHIVI